MPYPPGTNTLGRGLDRIISKVGVTLSCLSLAVAQELTSHVEALAQSHCDTGEAMA